MNISAASSKSVQIQRQLTLYEIAYQPSVGYPGVGHGICAVKARLGEDLVLRRRLEKCKIKA